MSDEQGISVAESGKAGINPDDVEQAVKAQFPIFKNPRMGDYLSMRACGFSIREACALAHISYGAVLHWRRTDEQFKDWEGKYLPHLQTNLAAIVTRAAFYRNFLWRLLVDEKVLRGAALNPDKLSDFYKGLTKACISNYNPKDLIALEHALREEGPDGEGDTFNIDKAIFIGTDGQAIVSEEGRRVAARALLEKVKSNEKYREHPEVMAHEAIEGEVVR